MSSDDLFLEQYRIIREILKKIVNTNDIDEVNFYNIDLVHRFKYFCKLKEKLLKGVNDNERI